VRLHEGRTLTSSRNTGIAIRPRLWTLTQSTASSAHHFWPLEYGPAGIRDEIRQRIAGHHQLADALLLDLAIRHAGRLATFDRRVPALLPADSPLRDSVDVIPA
jgi:predicted nucleic acid-binding protein